jgi:hypothetical protein
MSALHPKADISVASGECPLSAISGTSKGGRYTFYATRNCFGLDHQRESPLGPMAMSCFSEAKDRGWSSARTSQMSQSNTLG